MILTLILSYLGFLLLALGQPAHVKRLCPEWQGNGVWFSLFRTGGLISCLAATGVAALTMGAGFALLAALLAVLPTTLAVALTLCAKPRWLRHLLLKTNSGAENDQS